jgi:hypothetical protein
VSGKTTIPLSVRYGREVRRALSACTDPVVVQTRGLTPDFFDSSDVLLIGVVLRRFGWAAWLGGWAGLAEEWDGADPDT